MLQQFGKAQAWDMRPGIVNMEHALLSCRCSLPAEAANKKSCCADSAQQLFYHVVNSIIPAGLRLLRTVVRILLIR